MNKMEQRLLSAKQLSSTLNLIRNKWQQESKGYFTKSELTQRLGEENIPNRHAVTLILEKKKLIKKTDMTNGRTDLYEFARPEFNAERCISVIEGVSAYNHEKAEKAKKKRGKDAPVPLEERPLVYVTKYTIDEIKQLPLKKRTFPNDVGLALAVLFAHYPGAKIELNAQGADTNHERANFSMSNRTPNEGQNS